MYEDGSLVAKFSTFVLVGLSRRCMVRSSLGFGWVGFVLFFFRVVGTVVLGHGELVRMQGSGCGTTWLDWRETGSESWCAW